MTKSDWDYRGLAAESYDLWFPSEPYWDQEFFFERIRENQGIALEVASGTGRLLLPYLRDGLEVEGIDSSEEMLAICRQKARDMNLQPVLYQQLMQEMDLPRKYGTIFIPNGSFQILAEREEAFEALSGFRRHLEKGGELLIAVSVPWRDFPHQGQWRLRRSGTRPSDGATVLIHECTRSDLVEQVQDQWLRFEVFKDGEIVQSTLRTHRLRWYHKHEFSLMLERVGFSEISVRLGLGTEPPDAVHDTELVFSARS